MVGDCIVLRVCDVGEENFEDMSEMCCFVLLLYGCCLWLVMVIVKIIVSFGRKRC